LKLGYNTWSMPMLSFDESIELVARLGYDSLELTVCEGWPTDAALTTAVDWENWRRRADDLGIGLSSITANHPVVVHGAAWDAALDRLRRAFDLAATIQDPGQAMPVSLGAFIPSRSEGEPPRDGAALWAEHQALIIERFGILAAEAGDRGVRVALEPHVGAIVSRPDRALAVLEGVASDRLGLNLDISHFDVQGMDIDGVVAQLGPHAIVSEVKDQTGVVPDFQFLVPGEGDFDYARFVAAMARAGFDGAISVEISVLRQRGERPYDPAVAAAESYRVLAAAFDEVGVVRPGFANREGEAR
jgi:sugar phosphate isomerase/epimerase